MQKHISILAVLSAVTLAAHGNETAANNTNFGTAMTKYFDKKGSICEDLGPWPRVVHESTVESEVRELAALEAVGLVESKDTEVNAGARTVIGKARRYTLTDRGNFVKETSWPLDVPEGELSQKTFKADQINALEAAGLIKGNNTEVVIGNTKIKARRYALTDAASIVQKTDWPQDVTESEMSQKTKKANEMAGLETVGLLKGNDFNVTAEVKTKAKSYTLTAAANPFVQNKREIESSGVRKTSVDPSSYTQLSLPVS